MRETWERKMESWKVNDIGIVATDLSMRKHRFVVERECAFMSQSKAPCQSFTNHSCENVEQE